MDLFVGPDDITMDKDYKHIFKQLCNMIIHENGYIVCGIHFTHTLIWMHLKDSGSTDTHINHVLDPTNKQDIVLTYSLLKDLWSLPLVDLVNLVLSTPRSPTYIKMHNALWLYSELLYHLIFLYICVELLLSEQLKHISVVIHLVLALYVLDDAWLQFILTSLFVNISIMVKNAIFCVAKAKVDHPNKPFFLVLLETD